MQQVHGNSEPARIERQRIWNVQRHRDANRYLAAVAVDVRQQTRIQRGMAVADDGEVDAPRAGVMHAQSAAEGRQRQAPQAVVAFLFCP